MPLRLELLLIYNAFIVPVTMHGPIYIYGGGGGGWIYPSGLISGISLLADRWVYIRGTFILRAISNSIQGTLYTGEVLLRDPRMQCD